MYSDNLRKSVLVSSSVSGLISLKCSKIDANGYVDVIPIALCCDRDDNGDDGKSN
jgi:hypothetical protein